ncbi:ROK family protein [Rhodococcus sp. AD45-ID]|jgi:predicted NBD/HSP70 family sugar kinase|uniref:ROK family protein n=1 Tax=Rhodococcus TaxID=1827 RepID=UPI0005D36AD6|nr:MULTISPECIES: ROK family protein [Rhodococcus]KJF21289.1 Making large colonies protein [Rhodococcus sp. AD45]PSR38790.1 ROK family protein [Rhodococcus sp. AD45-ID]
MTRPPITPATAGEVFSLIRAGSATTRSEIGKLTGLSRTAVSARVSALQSIGLIADDDEGPSTGGRPPATLTFDKSAGLVLVVAIGRSRAQLAVTDLSGAILTAEDIDKSVGVGPDELMPEIADHLTSLLARIGRPPSEVIGVGLSIPGTVDVAAGASLDSPMMSGWDGVALAPYLASVTDAPLFADNDANVMALAELSERRESAPNLLMIKASTGLGAGIVLGGVLQRGSLGAAGEIGHTKTAAAKDIQCRCGDVGCVETVASGWALVHALEAQGRDVGHVRDVVRLALDGDGEARRLIRTSGRLIGDVISGAVNLLNPEVLVIGGDMAEADELFLAGLRESVYGNATALATRSLHIVSVSHGAQSGILGCAVLVLDNLLSPREIDLRIADAAR